MDIGKRQEQGIRAAEGGLLSSALEAVQDLNERCLTVLQRLAMQDNLQRLDGLAPCLRELHPVQLSRLGRLPFLLVDFAFGNPKVWTALLAEPVLRFPSPAGTLPAADASALAKGALALAQSVCRHHPAHAGLLLGLDPSLCAPIAQLRLPVLERLAEENPHLLKLRWENRPEVWRQLLSDGVATDEGARSQFRMYGLQLMAGEMAQHAGGVR